PQREILRLWEGLFSPLGTIHGRRPASLGHLWPLSHRVLPRWISHDHRRFHLAVRHVPVPHEMPFFLLRINNVESVLFIEANCPYRIGPGPDQHWPMSLFPQMG